jgi:hypothetical protein
MATKKIYTVNSYHRGRSTIYEGTLEYLTTSVFGYTLECGNSWNKKINRNPKTGIALVKALNQSADECRDYSDYYELVN